MRPTRAAWTVAALCACCGLLAVVLARPVLLAGTALLGAWLCGRQHLFVRELAATERGLAVDQSPARSGARTGESVPVTLAAGLAAPSGLALSIEYGLPTAAVPEAGSSPASLALAPGETGARTTLPVGWPVAGHHRFAPGTATATDGLFRERFAVGSTPTVTVEPHGARSVHVGAGGDRIAAAHGAHRTGRIGSGLEPAELREYVIGDTTDRIDWKATARLGTAHVREHEDEVDRTTLLLVDHRAALGVGPPAHTALEYLREVALATAASAHQFGDPIGLVTVGDAGVTTRLDPGTAAERYAAVRRTLLELEPTDRTRPDDRSAAERGAERADAVGDATAGTASDATAGTTDTTTAEAAGATTAEAGGADRTGGAGPQNADGSRYGGLGGGIPAPPTNPRSALAALADGDDCGAFGETLAPFYEARRTYRERYASDPLVGAARSTAAGHRGGFGWIVCCTDDSRPGELREAIQTLRAHADEVTVLLAPSELFAADGLADLERAYDRYVAFERFRRDIDRIDGVTALEVAPGDRLSSVLAAGRSRGTGGGTRGERA